MKEKRLLEELEQEQEELDKQFAAMSQDAAYKKLNERIAQLFSQSDWEALLLVEKAID